MNAERPIAPERLAAIRAPFEAFGGEWTDPPVLQPLSRLLDLTGEAMRARLFTVAGEGAGELCLRPDFTIPLAEAHIASGAATGRYLYEGKAFRTAPREVHRPVEFFQIGVEIYGEAADRLQRDAEVAALAWAAAAAGGRSDLRMILGDVALFDAFLSAIGVSDAARTRLHRALASGRVRPELSRAMAGEPVKPAPGGRLAQLLGGLGEAEAAGVLEEVWRLAGIQPVGGRSPAEIAHRLRARHDQAGHARITSAEAALIARYLDIAAPPREAFEQVEALAYEARAEFDIQLRPSVERLKRLVAHGVPEAAITVAPGFMRPFGYYDGLLFEVRSDSLGEDRPVAAGGRYDGLPARLGATGSSFAIGCMVRPARAAAEGAGR